MDEIPRCNILLFVATESEKHAVLDAAARSGITAHHREGRLGEFHDLGEVGANRVVLVRTGMGALDYRGSGARSVHYVYATQATGVISLGMAFGCAPETQKLCDVLVATQIVPYDNRDVSLVDGVVTTTYARVKRRRPKASLVAMMERYAESGQHEHGVHFGALLSGAARIHCSAFRDELRRSVPPKGDAIIGGEMEGVGLLASSDPEDPLWLVVKAISDFADEHRDEIIETSRYPACVSAATFVLGALAANP